MMKVKPVKLGKTERMSFSHIDEVISMPNLIEVQKNSYQWFLDEGLKEVFHDIGTIEDYTGNLALSFVDFRLDKEPKYSIKECKERDVTYAAPLRVTARLLNKETGEVKVVDYAACVDCGTPINPNLTRVQAEGGILQGIGMTLTEDITYKNGRMLENSLMQYKIPTRQDIGHIRVEFESSYEEQGPFGAKSIGEVVINTPLPAITAAIRNATGLWFRELPITPEKILMGRLKQQESEEAKVIR